MDEEPGAAASTAFAAPLLEQAVTGRITDEAWRQEVVERPAAAYGRESAAGAGAAQSAPADLVDGEV